MRLDARKAARNLMCGIAGFAFWETASDSVDDVRSVLDAMASTLDRRGPDDQWSWNDSDHIGLAFRRLSINDLSIAGRQPMVSPSGRYVVALNGEIYNHLTLRRDLSASGREAPWKGHSDAETAVAAIDQWTFEGALARFRGMYAIAAWDRQERTLLLARDPVGEKPLYYGWQRNGGQSAFLFGSQLKALARHPAFAGEISRKAMIEFVRFGFVPGPLSIYEGISKLPPGNVLRMAADSRELVIQPFWRAADHLPTQSGTRRTQPQLLEQLEALLEQSVSEQLTADVPIGAFLSGGVDSSAVVAVMQRISPKPMKTFSIGFDDPAHDEAGRARAVAGFLGTDHEELYVGADDATRILPELAVAYDEPFGDPSQVPTMILSEFARKDVGVCLTGDGGDELFGGYERYGAAADRWRLVNRMPASVRRRLASALKLLTASLPMHPAARLAYLSRLAGSASGAGFYKQLMSHFPDPGLVIESSGDRPTGFDLASRDFDSRDPADSMMFVDLHAYLPDDILVKVDRAAMHASLETRMPLLSQDIVEFALSLPLHQKRSGGSTKLPLRQLLHKSMPAALVERPKQGFGPPMRKWLLGPLRDWAETLMHPAQSGVGYFRPKALEKEWARFLAGERGSERRVWPLLMLQNWLVSQPAAGARFE